MAEPPARAVLVVEDESIVAHDLQQSLTEMGYDAFAIAASADEALARATERRPDIALVDIGLPRLDGYAFARAVRADPAVAGTPLVALTGYGQPEDRRRAIEAGFDAHLIKPVQPEELARTLASIAAARDAMPGRDRR